MVARDDESRVHAYGHASGGHGQTHDLAEIIQIPLRRGILKIRKHARRGLQSGARRAQEGRLQTFRSQHDGQSVAHRKLMKVKVSPMGHGGVK